MSAWWSNLEFGRRVLLVIGAVLVGLFLLFNTNLGKRALAYVGLEECVEVTLTGQVVCGDEAEQLSEIKERAEGASEQFEEQSDNLDAELDADAALARRNILTEKLSFSEADGYTVHIETTGIFRTDPSKVCSVMNEDGFTPAQVTEVESGTTTAC